MVLAHAGKEIPERALEKAGNKQAGGIAIDDLAVAARRFGLEGEIGVFDLNAQADLIGANTYPIVYLNRVHFDGRGRLPRKPALRRCVVGTVVPVRITGQYVWFNDPATGKTRRVPRRKFETARRDLGFWCVVCKPLPPLGR
jgi:hypothetical protein